MSAPIDVVTGAFSNTGLFVARRLLAKGRTVRTLTGHPERRDALPDVEAFGYDFERPERLEKALRGAETLYNGYWVRFDHGGMTYERAVANTRVLVGAAKAAGVKKVVQISIANPSEDSPFRYYKGKAALEKIVRESGLRYAIIRPTVIFGPDPILVNNIAYFLRNYPVFMIPGDGKYRIQPVYVEDLADLMVAEGASTQSRVMDAVGPETFAYDEFVALIARAVGGKAKLVHAPRAVVLAASRFLSLATGDVVLTPEEIDGLMADVLASRGAPTAKTRFTDWLAKNADGLGRRYLSEVSIHFDKERKHG